MKLVISKDKFEVGKKSAEHAYKILSKAIEQNGKARILLSTGASQFNFFDEFVKQPIEWDKVEMFHLDEYVGISEEHPASFKRYLIDRFISKVNLKKAYLIDGQKPAQETIAFLTEILSEYPIDLGLIGIGENAHIAFNDPPADFDDNNAYKVVTLDARCLQQQVGEGWFKNVDETYKQAISMTCSQIMKCKTIISVVPYSVKADAVYKTLTQEITPNIPATLLKKHSDCTIYCDLDSSKLLDKETIDKFSI